MSYILSCCSTADLSKEHFEHDERIKYIYSWENLGFGYIQTEQLEALRPQFTEVAKMLSGLRNSLTVNP